MTRSLSDEESRRLYEATRTTHLDWIARHRAAAGDRFPEKVTAFHDVMAVHGRFRKPRPVCGSPVQRIVYAGNECNCVRVPSEARSASAGLVVAIYHQQM